MNYWLDVFTEKSWQEFVAAGSSVSGFPKRMIKTVNRINVGDIMLCYMVKRSVWFAALEVVSKAYYDDKNIIWSDDVYPCRIKIKPELVLNLEDCIPLDSTVPKLKLFDPVRKKDVRARGFVLRPSPKKLLTEDGEYLMHELKTKDPIAKTKLKRLNIPYSGRLHEKIKTILSEIGELEGLRSNTEYQRFDVIWRSRDDSVPSTY